MMRNPEASQSQRYAVRLTALAAAIVVIFAGSATAAYAGSTSYSKSDASTTWKQDPTTYCYGNGHSIEFTTSTNFASGGEVLRAWDKYRDSLLGTSAVMNVVGTTYTVASGPSGTNEPFRVTSCALFAVMGDMGRRA